MKKVLVVAVALVCCFALAGCGSNQQANSRIEKQNAELLSAAETVMPAKIIEVKHDVLLVAAIDGSSNDLYTIKANTPLIGSNELKPGMLVDIGHGGFIEEIYPAIVADPIYIKIVEEKNDLVGFYKQMLMDLLAKDQGLNDGIEILAFDLSKAVNLSEVEKSALLYLIWQETHIETRQATYDQLVAEKLINPTQGFETGLLLSLDVFDVQKDSFMFTADKYRGPLGAYYFHNCSALLKNGAWSYSIGDEMIS